MALIAVRRIAACAALAILAFAFPQDQRAFAQEKLVLRTDFPPVPIHAGLFLAQVKGWFKQAGIDLEIQDGRGSTNTIQLVGAGQVDIGYVSLGSIMPAREAGMKIKSFAAVSHKSDLGVIYDPKRMSSVADLRGKTLLCFAGSSWTPFIPMFFKGAGVDPSSVTLLNIDVNAMWTSYMAGKGDGVFSFPPYGLALVQKQRPSRAFLAADYGVPLLGYGLVARDDEIASHAIAFGKVAQIVARAWTYIYNGHEAEGLKAIQTERPEAKVNPEVFSATLANYRDYFFTPQIQGKPLFLQLDSEWAAALKTEETAGLIKPGHATSEFYTNEIVDKLKQ
jgi:NitT/TauT family transport system substrate-binding protein